MDAGMAMPGVQATATGKGGKGLRRRRWSVSEEADAIRVAVRVRPFSRREKSAGAKRIVEMDGETASITDPTAFLHVEHQSSEEAKLDNVDVWTTRFTFDRCFWSFDQRGGSRNKFASQQDVFDTYGPWIISNAMQGFNCSLFAYGQTGSGKTHTMMGESTDVSAEGSAGFIPRLCKGVFQEIARAGSSETGTFHLEASYFEIYNERVFDLLNYKDKGGAQASLRVREHPKTGAYVEDLLTIAVSSYNEIEELLKQGATSRSVAETQMNQVSSRSHAVFQLVLRNERVCNDGNRAEKISRLYLVDLAGSERVSASGATGARLKEAANINRSLSALSDVIKALTSPRQLDANGATGKQFVPYRNSSLTWLLKESLGGNAKTVMLATLSPDATNYQETLSTLKYAERAKKIVNRARVNKESNGDLVEALKQEIASLREQLAKYEEQELNTVGAAPEKAAVHQKRHLLVRLKSQEKLVSKLSTTWEEKREHAQSHFASLEQQNEALQEERDKMAREVDELKTQKQILENREAEEERKRQERQERRKAQIEQQLCKRKADQTKQAELQRKLDAANARIAGLEGQVEAMTLSERDLEASLRREQQRTKEASIKFERSIAKERQKVVRRESRLENLYRIILTQSDQTTKEEDCGSAELECKDSDEIAEPQDKSSQVKKNDAIEEIEEVLTAQLSLAKSLQLRLSDTERELKVFRECFRAVDDEPDRREAVVASLRKQLEEPEFVKLLLNKKTNQGSWDNLDHLQQANQELQQKLEAATETLREVEAAKDKQEAEHRAFQGRVEKITEDIGSKQGTIAQLTLELQEGLSKAQAQEHEVSRLEKLYSESEAESAALRLARDDLDDKVDTISVQLEEKRKQVTRLQAENESLRARSEELNAQVLHSAMQMDSLKESADAVRPSLDNALEELERKDTELESAVARVAELESTLARERERASTRLVQLHDESEQAKASEEALRENLDVARVELEAAQHANESVRAELADTKLRLSELEQDFVELTDRHDEVAEKLSEKENEFDELEEQLRAQQQTFQLERNELRLSLAGAHKELDVMAAAQALAEEGVSLSEQEHENAQQRTRELMDQHAREKQELLDELHTKTAECEKWRASEMQAVKANSRLELEALTVREQVDFLKEREKTLQEKLAQMSDRHFAEQRASEEQLFQVQQRVKQLEEELHEAKHETELLVQKMENERVAFDQIFKAQTEALTYSTFRHARTQK
ncbi:Kinesin-like protein KIF13A [Durusdinium trenchii]|uniref:Kinesin-like protein KIF13A n=1 Tax=Durusdinium trenchii TaxID=1381693 RepID=A0ABP0RBF5_9DINO